VLNGEVVEAVDVLEVVVMGVTSDCRASAWPLCADAGTQQRRATNAAVATALCLDAAIRMRPGCIVCRSPGGL
jgi:hypothetical protein